MILDSITYSILLYRPVCKNVLNRTSNYVEQTAFTHFFLIRLFRAINLTQIKVDFSILSYSKSSLHA